MDNALIGLTKIVLPELSDCVLILIVVDNALIVLGLLFVDAEVTVLILIVVDNALID